MILGERNVLSENRTHTRGYGLNQWPVLGIMVLVCVWFGMSPPVVHSRVSPSSSNNLMTGEDWLRSLEPNRSWSAFRSDDAKNVCVTVVNDGASEVFVHLFRNRSLAGAFTVLPHRVSAICSDVTVIELECGSGSCQPRWYISDPN